MKKILFSLVAVILCSQILAQSDYSGAYGYSFPVQGNPPKDAKATGPSGNLVLIKMENNKYRFWLDIKKGWPSNKLGATDGTINIVNDTASFNNAYEGSKDSCGLHFTVTKEKIKIESTASGYDCNFSDGVTADGDYTRLEIQPPFDNNWLKKQYPEAPVATVIIKKAQLYNDENCRIEKQQVFPKDQLLLNVTENENTFYTEYINTEGKFIYGWIKKSAVKMKESD